MLLCQFLVYSIDDDNSFNSLERWLNDLKSKSSSDVKIFLIGNKEDLEHKRKITKAMGEKFCNDHKIAFFNESSAKTGFNIRNIFIEAAKVLYLQHEEIKNRASRPGSMSLLEYTQENNKYRLETEDEENRKSKKFCCF